MSTAASDDQTEIRTYLARWGITPTSIVPLSRHAAGMVYRANGDQAGDLYVILDAGPPAHFPVRFAEQETEPWRSVLRWYHGGLALISAKSATKESEEGPA
jgi:hypothetical protein